MSGSSNQILQFKITLQDITPPVWRRIQVPAACTFWDLHVAIQDAMGWQDYHLHLFDVTNPQTGQAEHIGIPDDEGFDDEDTVPGWERRVSDCLSLDHPRAKYEYDFGDGWQHELLLEEVLPAEEGAAYPRCVAGARACPPEDVGGAWGYEQFLKSIRDPDHEEHEQNLTWVGGAFLPEVFDPGQVSFDDPQQRWRQAFGDTPGAEENLWQTGPPSSASPADAGLPPTGIDAFEGLSPAQMHELLYAPLDPGSSPMVLNTDLPDAAFAEAPFPRDCTRYLSMLRERQPLKLTQRGNLPRRFVTELWEAGVLTEDAPWFPDSAPRNEGASLYLPLISSITAHSGLTRKRHGKLALTRKAEAFLDKKPAGELYRHLFEYYATRYNWAHGDRLAPSWILQGAFGFSLLLLQRYGREQRLTGFYAERFRHAFPALAREFPGSAWTSPEEEYGRAYKLRVLTRFAVRFGLAEEEEVEDDTLATGPSLVRAAPLLEQLVQWRTEGADEPKEEGQLGNGLRS